MFTSLTVTSVLFLLHDVEAAHSPLTRTPSPTRDAEPSSCGSRSCTVERDVVAVDPQAIAVEFVQVAVERSVGRDRVAALQRPQRRRRRDGQPRHTACSHRGPVALGPTPFLPFAARRRSRERTTGSRTRDLELGKLAVTELSYVRVRAGILGRGPPTPPASKLCRVSARAFASFWSPGAVALLGFGLLTAATAVSPSARGPPAPSCPVLDDCLRLPLSSGQLRGRVGAGQPLGVVVGPCREESPALSASRSSTRRGDRARDQHPGQLTDDATREFVRRVRPHLSIQLDAGTASPLPTLGATGVPESVLVDPDGNAPGGQ